MCRSFTKQLLLWHHIWNYTRMHRLRWDLVVSFEGVGSVINGPQIYLTRGMQNSPWHLENYTQLLLQLFSGGNIGLQNASSFNVIIYVQFK